MQPEKSASREPEGTTSVFFPNSVPLEGSSSGQKSVHSVSTGGAGARPSPDGRRLFSMKPTSKVEKKWRQLHTWTTSMSKTQWKSKTFEANVQKLNEKSRLSTKWGPESGVRSQISWSLLRKSKKSVDSYTLETGILTRLHEICPKYIKVSYNIDSSSKRFNRSSTVDKRCWQLHTWNGNLD